MNATSIIIGIIFFFIYLPITFLPPFKQQILIFRSDPYIVDSLSFHLPQKGEYRYGGHGGSVAYYPPDVREHPRVISAQNGPLHLHGVDEWQQICDLLERAAHQPQVKPDAGEPRRQVRE